MTESAFLRLSQQVGTGEVSVAAAFEQLKKLPKPWESAEWKAKRAAKLGACCAHCGGNTESLTLFNHELPLPYYDLKTQLRNELSIANGRAVFDSITEAEAEAVMVVDPALRDACPTCGILTMRARKNRTPRYLCARNHGFEQPVARTYYPIAKTTDKAVALDAARSFLTGFKMRELLQENDAEISRLALVMSLQQSAAYISLAQVTTLCRSCHYQARAEGLAAKWERLPLVPLITRFKMRKT